MNFPTTTSNRLSSLARSTLLHCLLIGALLHIGYSRLIEEPARPLIHISTEQFTEATQEWFKKTGQAPDESQKELLVNQLIKQEILYRQALEKGYDELPAARARLIKLAEFLELAPDETDKNRLYKLAKDAGLAERDTVVRQLLINLMSDIHLADLSTIELSEQALQDYFEQHIDLYTQPAKTRLSHVYIKNKSAKGLQRATKLSQHLQAQNIAPEEAPKLGDAFYGSYHIPLLAEQKIAGQFGTEMARQVMALPAQQWSAPLSSPYGYHIVWIHQRLASQQAPFEDAKSDVEKRLYQQKQQQAFEQRMIEQRQHYQIELPAISNKPVNNSTTGNEATGGKNP